MRGGGGGDYQVRGGLPGEEWDYQVRGGTTR